MNNNRMPDQSAQAAARLQLLAHADAACQAPASLHIPQATLAVADAETCSLKSCLLLCLCKAVFVRLLSCLLRLCTCLHAWPLLLQPKDYSIKMNRKEKKVAMATALQSAAPSMTVVKPMKVGSGCFATAGQDWVLNPN